MLSTLLRTHVYIWVVYSDLKKTCQMHSSAGFFKKLFPVWLFFFSSLSMHQCDGAAVLCCLFFVPWFLALPRGQWPVTLWTSSSPGPLEDYEIQSWGARFNSNPVKSPRSGILKIGLEDSESSYMKVAVWQLRGSDMIGARQNPSCLWELTCTMDT